MADSKINNVFMILALVSFVTSALLQGNNGDGVAVTRTEDGNVQESTRLRRALVQGAFTHKTNQQSSFVRRKFHHKLSSSPEGGVSMETRHHHEKGSMAQAAKKAGYFA